MADWFAEHAPKPAQPAAVAATGGDWFAQHAPTPKPPEVSPVENAASAFWEGIGGGGILDIIRGGTSGNPEDAKKAVATIQALAGGVAHEPARVSEELARANIGRDPGKTLYHLAGAVPFVGAGIQQTSDDFAKGDYARGVGHGLAILLPFLAGPAGRGAARTAEAVGTAAETALPVTRAVVKAGGRDVAVGAGKTAVGAALAKAGPLGEIGDVLAGVPIIKSGVKQISQGVKSGYKAGREALAQRATAAAPLVERPAPAWQRLAEVPEAATAPLADLSAQLQAAIDEMNARALERQGPAAPPPPARPAPAWQRATAPPETPPAPLADLSQKLQAIIDERNARALERQAPVESRPAAAAAAAAETPGQAFAKAQGIDYESLSKTDRAMLENVAQAQANVSAQPAPQPIPRPAAAPEAVPQAAAAPAAPAGLPPMEEILAAPPTRGLNVSPALLEDVAQGQAGKPFRELGQADQVKVIEIARRIQSEPAAARPNLPPEEPPPAPIAATPETVPPAPPVGTLAETPATAPAAEPNVFVKNARLAKAVRVADAAQELGLTREDVYKMVADVEKRNEFAKRIGEKSISPDTMALVVDKIAKAESAAARAAAPAPKPTPVAEALAKFEAEKAKKSKAK